MKEFNAILTIAYRDFIKLLRDRARLVSTLIFPLIFIAVLGGSLQSNLGQSAGYNFLTFTFTGVLAQTLFMSATQGVISLMDDRENDFSQEMFVSPISRYSIIFGKILGETFVALTQGIGIVLFGVVIGIPFSVLQIIGLVPIALVVCLFGGAFGVLILSTITSRRAGEQIFNFVLLPQFFLAGVFNPIQVLPWYLDILSKISPMRYAVDLLRGVFYTAQPEYTKIVLQGPLFNLIVGGGMFSAFLVGGTLLFVRRERNR